MIACGFYYLLLSPAWYLDRKRSYDHWFDSGHWPVTRHCLLSCCFFIILKDIKLLRASYQDSPRFSSSFCDGRCNAAVFKFCLKLIQRHECRQVDMKKCHVLASQNVDRSQQRVWERESKSIKCSSGSQWKN
jgi:hypothetical protein